MADTSGNYGVKFDLVTIFPAMVRSVLGVGVIGRAIEEGRLDVGVHDLRDFADDRHRTVDDAPYGGGPGMVMKAPPFCRAVAQVAANRGAPDAVILTTPQGAPLTHRSAQRFSRCGHIVLLCGRYEAVDERVREAVVTDEVSIGDYVVTGGELPALVILDAVGRLVPGIVGDAESVEYESFAHGLLDFPQYTRPAEFDGRRVPDVLVSGNHGAVRTWRKRRAIERTLARRPDLLSQGERDLDQEERTILRQVRDARRATRAGAGA